MPISNLSNGLRTGVCTSTNRPTTPYEGQHIYETDTDIEYVWSGTAWVVNYVSAASPTFTGTPLAPTATTGTNTTQLATTAFANAAGGLVYITNATIGTGVSSVAVASAFSSTYDNYKIMVNGGIGSVPQAINMILTGSTASYYQILAYWSYAAGTPTVGTSNNAASWGFIGEASPNANTIDIDIINPNLAKYTYFGGHYMGTVAGTISGYHGVATAYTGFTLTVGGTMTGGTITVYGYRKA